ncbi:2Fe-2S iron-sulfur cluster binding domain-containing protein [Anabaena sp. FACHB-1237]|uniref:2Fe-2S iron-sulfur cluster-binding protein n=1 Tax=Anabaena sp. FACHB-1237 TaxID=2692769 RepID=UPI0018F037FC
MKIEFLPDKVTTDAEIGELILDVAERAGISIPTGCLMGTCHACTVELDNGEDEPEIIRACISGVPPIKPGQEKLIINLFSDPTW